MPGQDDRNGGQGFVIYVPIVIDHQHGSEGSHRATTMALDRRVYRPWPGGRTADNG